MKYEKLVPEPLIFNPLKHYLAFIRDFISINTLDSGGQDLKNLIRDLKHLGTSVMDVYTGDLSQPDIFREIMEFLNSRNLVSKELFATWVGTKCDDFRITAISDSSRWTLKFHDNEKRFVHIFPARLSPRTFRIKSNTLKSAILYLILIGKDYVTEEDLNRARAFTGLSPVKEVSDTQAIIELIEILRL